MREDPMILDAGALGFGVADDNVVALPNLTSGRLADLLAAASGPGQSHELRGESEARATFLAASGAWPTPRRRLRRTPAVLAVTTVATMMVATTGLAAASQLPGPAGRAVQGILGSVGVSLAPAAPSGTPAPAGSPGGAPGSGAQAPAGTHRVGPSGTTCVINGTPTATTGGIQTASCTLPPAPRTTPVAGVAAASTTPGALAVAPASTRTPVAAAAPAVHVPRVGTHQGGLAGGIGAGGQGSIGGGTTRGGNKGGGGGSCGTGGSGGSTGGTTPSGPVGTSATTAGSTDPASDATTPTTATTAAAAGCGGHTGGHHHSGSGGTGTGGTGATGSDTGVTTTP